VLTPGLVPDDAQLVPEDVVPTQLDALPPELDADWAARVASDELLHVECQGYKDEGFAERALWYHLGFALRNRGKRRVHTVVLWLNPLPAGQPRHFLVHADIRVRVKTIVLPDVPASRLLEEPSTACFAPGANRGTWSDEELCARVATVLAQRKASWPERHMAAVAAMMRSRYRYERMLAAMEQAHMEPVIIEDLVKIGEDRGRINVYTHSFAQRLARALTDVEIATLEQRLATLGMSRVNEVLWTSSPMALAAWLADPTAR
jgi:hypothetical protein